MKGQKIINVAFEVVCECGNSLKAWEQNNVIEVECCEDCLAREYDKGYKEGKNE